MNRRHRLAAPESEPSAVMNVADLAKYLRVHRSMIYRLLKRGELPAFRVGSDWRFNREQIDAWRLAQQARPI